MNNKDLLYKKLRALRLEVDSSIVDDIIATADAAFVSQHDGKPIVSGSLPPWPDVEKRAKDDFSNGLTGVPYDQSAMKGTIDNAVSANLKGAKWLYDMLGGYNR